MPQIVFPEFRDTTRSIKYPFVDTASLTDTTKQITLPNDIITDISIFFPGNSYPMHLEKLQVLKDSVKFIFSATTITTTDIDVNNSIIGTISTLTDISNKDTLIPLFTAGVRTGTMLINSLKLPYFRGLPLGTYSFFVDSTLIVPTCVMDMPKVGLQSIAVNYKNEENTIRGKVWLIGHDGVFIRTDPNTPNSVRIDVVGDALYKKAADGVEKYEIKSPVRTINGVGPDEYGNFNISTKSKYDAIRVQNTERGIVVSISGATNVN